MALVSSCCAPSPCGLGTPGQSDEKFALVQLLSTGQFWTVKAFTCGPGLLTSQLQTSLVNDPRRSLTDTISPTSLPHTLFRLWCHRLESWKSHRPRSFPLPVHVRSHESCGCHSGALSSCPCHCLTVSYVSCCTSCPHCQPHGCMPSLSCSPVGCCRRSLRNMRILFVGAPPNVFLGSLWPFLGLSS